MTHIVVHTNPAVRQRYLLKLVNHLLQKEFTDSQLYNIPDLHFVNEKNGSIGIEIVKELQKQMIYKPFNEIYQIGVISQAHLLTHEAQNALLKTLEEQPETTAYILLLDNEKNVLETILSRGVKHYVKEQDKKKEVQTVPKPSILNFNIIEQFKTIDTLSQQDTKEVLELLKGIQQFFRIQLRGAIKNNENIDKIYRNIEIVNTAYQRIKANGNKKLVLENMIMQIDYSNLLRGQ